MKQNYGKVLEVFIPNNEGIDSKNIGFKVLLDDGTKLEIIEEKMSLIQIYLEMMRL